MIDSFSGSIRTYSNRRCFVSIQSYRRRRSIARKGKHTAIEMPAHIISLRQLFYPWTLFLLTFIVCVVCFFSSFVYYLQNAEYEIIDDSQEHWWKVKDQHGNIGYIPSNYVKPKETLGLDKYE